MPFSLNMVLLLNIKRADLSCVFLPDTFCTFSHIISVIKADVKVHYRKGSHTRRSEEFSCSLFFLCAAPGALTCVTCWSDTVWTTSTAQSHQELTPAIEDIPSTIKFCKRFVWFKVLPVGSSSICIYQRLFHVDGTYLFGEECKY